MILPLGLQREVDAHLKAHLSQKSMHSGSFSDNSLRSSSSFGSVATDAGLHEQREPLMQNSVAMEKILRRKSLQLQTKQQDWQVCNLLYGVLSFCCYPTWQVSPSYMCPLIPVYSASRGNIH